MLDRPDDILERRDGRSYLTADEQLELRREEPPGLAIGDRQTDILRADRALAIRALHEDPRRVRLQ